MRPLRGRTSKVNQATRCALMVPPAMAMISDTRRGSQVSRMHRSWRTSRRKLFLILLPPDTRPVFRTFLPEE